MNDSPKKNNRLFLIDGTALAYRSYFAFIKNPLINSKGINTSGVYGFTAALLRLIRKEDPHSIACVFDTSAPTFRHKRYPQYKATREKMPEELAQQFPFIRQVVENFNLPLLEKEGFEADDIIGTLARRGEAEGMDVFLVTSDKDFMQLVNDRIRMYMPSRRSDSGEVVLFGPAQVKEKMGVPPGQIIDLLALMGDSSDNIPGVPGIGPKTAVKLIEEYGSFDAVLAAAPDMKSSSTQRKLVENKDKALLSRELVTIDTAVPLEVTLADLSSRPPDVEKILSLFRKLEFTRMADEVIALQGGKRPQELKRSYITVSDRKSLENFLKELRKQLMFAVDTETTSLRPLEAELVGLSFSWEKGNAYYIPVKAPLKDRPGTFLEEGGEKATELVLERLRPILEDPEKKKCGQNIKYDLMVLKRYGIELAGTDFDCMIAAYLLNPSAQRLNLDVLSMEYLGMKKIPTKELIGSGKSQITMDQVPLTQVAEYAAEDADAAFSLRKVLEPKLTDLGLDTLFQTIEMPLMPVLAQMEETGVKLDTALLAEMSGQMEKKLLGIMEEIYDIAGEEFNINSTQQLGSILFEKLKVHEMAGWKRPRRTKTGYATDVRVMEALSIHPLPRKILEYRQFTKLKSTYVDALPQLVNPATGRVHTSFNQTITATGRLSTSDPNLQNIPVRTEAGKEIRKAFIAGERGWKLLSADYSQIELRVMAHVSGDRNLIEAFQKGEDVHRSTAAKIFKVDPDQVTEQQRYRAKTINFGVMYGMGAYGLASRLEISNQEAQEFIDAYFERYPEVNNYVARTIGKAYEDGYVTTLLGRRRYLPELASSNQNLRRFAERTAVNMPIQGTAADIIKLAMIAIERVLRRQKLQTRMILQIHDELLFEVPDQEVESLKKIIVREMEGAVELTVPVSVDVGVGENWYEAH